MSVAEKDLGWKRILEDIRELHKSVVTAGLHEEEAGTSEPNNVIKGVINEFGTGNIPERSFVRATHDQKKKEWIQLIKKNYDRLLKGYMNPKKFLEELGERASEDIRTTVVEMKDPPNAPLTIAKKGFDDPLIETGEMRDAISYKLR